MHIKEQELKIVKDILNKNLPNDTKIYVFGSRATGIRLKRFSDLDLVVDTGEKIPFATMASIRFDFEESDLPYKVDVLDWNDISLNFKENIEKDMILLDFS